MKFFAAATIATVSANTYDFMGEDQLLAELGSTLSSAQMSEARAHVILLVFLVCLDGLKIIFESGTGIFDQK